jgi:hypothetical protein
MSTNDRRRSHNSGKEHLWKARGRVSDSMTARIGNKIVSEVKMELEHDT